MFLIFVITLTIKCMWTDNFGQSSWEEENAIHRTISSRNTDCKDDPEIFINQTIYFLETSGRNSLDLRQLASIESVARYVQHQRILVLIFTSRTVQHTTAMCKLTQNYNVTFLKSTMKPYFERTPLQEWYESKAILKSPYMVAHISDALRSAILWKQGGIYMDLDIIMFRAYNVSKPTIYWETNQVYLANCMYAFEKGNQLLELYMRAFSTKYDAYSYPANGPWLLTEVFYDYKDVLSESGQCFEVDEAHPDFFSKVNFNRTSLYFRQSATEEMLREKTNETFGIHVWNSENKDIKISPALDCAYMYYVRRSCPIVYKEMSRLKLV